MLSFQILLKLHHVSPDKLIRGQFRPDGDKNMSNSRQETGLDIEVSARRILARDTSLQWNEASAETQEDCRQSVIAERTGENMINEERDYDAERCPECGKYGADGHTHDCMFEGEGE